MVCSTAPLWRDHIKVIGYVYDEGGCSWNLPVEVHSVAAERKWPQHSPVAVAKRRRMKIRVTRRGSTPGGLVRTVGRSCEGEEFAGAEFVQILNVFLINGQR